MRDHYGSPRWILRFSPFHGVQQALDVLPSCLHHCFDVDLDESPQAEIAYVLRRDYWRQGLATEIAQRLLQFGFEAMAAHRIFATCRPANTASWRVLEKIGMQREGHLRQHRWMKGSWHDSFLYAILDHEYKQRQLTST